MNNLLIILSLFSILSSIAILITNNPVISTLFLILVFFFTSLFLFFFGLDFMAFIFLIIYIGAIAVLFLFVVMMLRIKKVKFEFDFKNVYIFFLFLLIFINFIYIYIYIYEFLENLNFNRFFDFNIIKEISLFTVNAYIIGFFLYTDYFFIFLCCGLLLLLSMIGSIFLTLQYSIGFKKQKDFNQILIKYNKNINLKINDSERNNFKSM